MLLSLWNWLVWLATVDYMWISAGVSVALLCCATILRKYYTTGEDKNAVSSFFGLIYFCALFGTIIYAYPNGPGTIFIEDSSRFHHFLLWHLVALGAVATGIVGWFSVKGLRKLWGIGKNFAKNLFGKWQVKQENLKEIRGDKISEELELRRKELEKLMGDGAISDTPIRAQVAGLFSGPFTHLLEMRRFLLKNTKIFDETCARVLKNPMISAEAKKEISEKREGLNKKLVDVNASLNRIALVVDRLIIRIGEIRVGLGQGSLYLDETLSELNEIVESIEDGVQKTAAGAPEEFDSITPSVQEGVKVKA